MDAVGLGALNVDRLYRVASLLQDGESFGDDFGEYPGGSAANTIYALARLGMSTGFFGAVGDDPEGRLLLRSFTRAGTDTSGICVKRKARTGIALAISDRQGSRSLYIFPGANSLLTASDVDMAVIGRCRLVHMSSFLGEGQQALQRELLDALPQQAALSFAPGLLYVVKGWQWLQPFLRRASVVFMNGDELGRLTGERLLPGIARCLEAGAGSVVVTLGAGLPLVGDERLGEAPDMEVVRAPVPPGHGRDVRIVALVGRPDGCYLVEASIARRGRLEATGAGDAFAAGFLFGYLEGKGPVECGRLGHTEASFMLTKPGARSGLPNRAVLLNRVKSLFA
ncbi:MAG: carbohydrate kinase family protein [Chloroflexi bacterium]|nr:carbohydrate kinase family protein [Chloroflexota bacterium]